MVTNLPNFILVGAAKTGTTFLLKYLEQHPDIYIPNSNELYFHSKLKNFQGPYDKEKLKKQTRSFKDYIKYFKNYNGEKIIGEFATDYLYAYEESIKSIKETIGRDVKIIIVLRNPVDRSFSQYRHVVTKRQEPLEFWDAVNAQDEREKKKWRWTYQYINTSKYYSQVKAYIEAFDNVKVIIHEDIKANPKRTVEELYKFLGVEVKHFYNITEKVNVKRVYKSKIFFKLSKLLEKVEGKLFNSMILSEIINRLI
ncbi:MAG: hypothetical protein B6229_08725 [Spirochaetaceae bacterium 4572_7]|nr:MAG: hypothetical protein B6229_08725 [Spirochaetaceae bacterium 4572_7]